MIERGKAVLVSTDKKFVVADHNFTKSTFTPTVLLHSKIPEDLSEVFYQGDLYVAIRENSFEHSSILRHCAENIKVLDGMPSKPIEHHYHDGGIDHYVRHPKAQIIIFAYALSRKLDALTLLQTPWNPVECKMTQLNLAWQGIRILRNKTTNFEQKLNSCNGLNAIRAEKYPELIKRRVLRSSPAC